MATTLLNFPAEVLATLAQFLPYEDLENLWNTQSLRLQKVLGHSRGIRAIDFEFTGQTRAFPSLAIKTSTLSTLTIASLVLAPSPTADRLHPNYATWASLPKSLTQLRLRFPLAEVSLALARQGDKILPRYSSSDGVEPSEYINLAEMLPNLSTLEVDGTDTLGDNWFKVLPASLTSLTVSRNTKFTDEGIRHLSPSIETLRLPSASRITGSGLTHLTGLSAISLSGSFGKDQTHVETETFLKHLPKSLTELELAVNRLMTQEHVSLLPENLIRLNLASNNNIKNFAALPKSLLFLALSTPVEPAQIAALPPNLRTLILLNGRQLNNECLSALPRSLTSISIWHALDLEDEALPLLPQGLRSIILDAPKLTNAAAAIISSPHLRLLRLLSCPLGDEFVAELKTPYLTRLDLGSAKELTNDAIKHLPRTLRHLSIVSSKKITPACLPDLPRGLLHVSAMSASGFIMTPINSFPPSIRTFYTADRMVLPERNKVQVPTP